MTGAPLALPKKYTDIPSEFKGIERPCCTHGARLTLTKHARLRFWQRIRPNVTDHEIVEEAVSALHSGDPRFRFRAHIFDNPYRPTSIRLITVLSSDMRLPPFFVDCRWEYDKKWHQHLAEQLKQTTSPTAEPGAESEVR
jgi:hypothetical protein